MLTHSTNGRWPWVACCALTLYLSAVQQVVAKPMDIGSGGDLMELLERIDDSDDSAGQ